MHLSKKAGPKRPQSGMVGDNHPMNPVALSAGAGYVKVAKAFELLEKGFEAADLVVVRDDIIRNLFGEAQNALRALAQALFESSRDANVKSRGV